MHPRIIKFKVWYKTLGRFINFEILPVVDFKSPLYEFLQFTGLTDSKGKEVWEGDVVSRRNQWDFDEFAVVSFEAPAFCAKTADGVNLLNFNNIQVIGNICENPGLV